MTDTPKHIVYPGLDVPLKTKFLSLSLPLQQLSCEPQSQSQLQSQLHDSIFIDLRSLKYISQPLDHLVCPICQSPFIIPYTTICGHTFCKSCILESLRAGLHGGSDGRNGDQSGEEGVAGGLIGRCPLDRTCLWFDFDGEFHPSVKESEAVDENSGLDVGSSEDTTNPSTTTTTSEQIEQHSKKENDIFPSPIIITNITDDLQVYCVNSERGCNWVGPRWSIKTHAMDECEFTRFTCGKLKLDGTVCDVLTERKFLNEHEAIVVEEDDSNANDIKDVCPHDLFPCEKCTELVSKVDLQWHLQNECEENKLKCNGCNSEIPLKNYESHEMVCEKVHIKCSGSSYGCDWRGRRDLLNEVHVKECIFVKLTGYFDKQQEKMNSIIDENRGLKNQLSTVLDSVIQGRMTNLGYSLQLEEVRPSNNNSNSDSKNTSIDSLFSRFANGNLQDEDYVHLIIEFEKLRSDIDKIGPILSEFELNRQIVNTLMNENIQLKEEVNNHRVALNSLRQQLQFMMLERRRVIRPLGSTNILGGSGNNSNLANEDSASDSFLMAESRLKL